MTISYQTEVVPAIMPNSAEHLDELAQTVSAFSHTAQIDVMDGKFVPPISWPYGSGQMKELEYMQMLPGAAQVAYEVHLMVEDPRNIGVVFAQRGARRIIGHIETMGHANDALDILKAWRDAGAEVGISLLLDTSLSEIEGIIPDVDAVQVMSIAQIGYQGHPFDERAIARIRELRNMHPILHIAVDGGVSPKNARALVDAGANKLCVGSAIMKTPDSARAYHDIMNAISNV